MPKQLLLQLLLKANDLVATNVNDSQSFEKPPSAKKTKSHSPNFDKEEWDKNQVILDLQAHPKENAINWSKFAREHGVGGANAGQIAKEFAQARDK